MITLAKFAVAAVIAAATATTPAGCDTTMPPPQAPVVAPATPAAPPVGRRDIEVQTNCEAYDVVPDTPDARARADEMCANMQRSLNEVGW